MALRGLGLCCGAMAPTKGLPVRFDVSSRCLSKVWSPSAVTSRVALTWCHKRGGGRGLEEEGELNAVLAGTMDSRLGWRVDADDVCFVAKAARRFSRPTRRSRAPNIRLGPRGRDVAGDSI